jgi:hypothetical protein
MHATKLYNMKQIVRIGSSRSQTNASTRSQTAPLLILAVYLSSRGGGLTQNQPNSLVEDRQERLLPVRGDSLRSGSAHRLGPSGLFLLQSLDCHRVIIQHLGMTPLVPPSLEVIPLGLGKMLADVSHLTKSRDDSLGVEAVALEFDEHLLQLCDVSKPWERHFRNLYPVLSSSPSKLSYHVAPRKESSICKTVAHVAIASLAASESEFPPQILSTTSLPDSRVAETKKVLMAMIVSFDTVGSKSPVSGLSPVLTFFVRTIPFISNTMGETALFHVFVLKSPIDESSTTSFSLILASPCR